MTWIASGGVIVAAAALFIVLSVFAGLKEFSLQFTALTDPDLKLFPKQGKSFQFTDTDYNALLQIEGINIGTKIIEERIVIRSDGKQQLVILKGVDANYSKVTQIDSMITRGQWVVPETNDVVSGWGIANSLSFGLFNFQKSLSLFVPKPGKGQISSLKSAYNVVGVNNVGLFEINEQLNNEYIFSDINLAQRLLNYKNHQISTIELKLLPNANETTIRSQINKTFKGQFIIKNRAQLNDALYKMLNTEHLAIYLIFTLVIIIALFNVIGAIIMMILDRKKSLNTLFSLGAETKTIKRVFFLHGTLLTVVSGSIGVVLGFLITWLQIQTGIVKLSPELSYPVSIKPVNLLIVLGTIFTLGLVASKLASQRITKSLIQKED